MTIQFHEWRLDRINALCRLHGIEDPEAYNADRYSPVVWPLRKTRQLVERTLNRRDEIKQWIDHILIDCPEPFDCIDLTGLKSGEISIATKHVADEFRWVIWEEAAIAPGLQS